LVLITFIFNQASVRRQCFSEHINYLTDCDLNIDQNKASDALTSPEAINAQQKHCYGLLNKVNRMI